LILFCPARVCVWCVRRVRWCTDRWVRRARRWSDSMSEQRLETRRARLHAEAR